MLLKILVLAFEPDLDAGAQELRRAGQLAGKIFLAFLGRGAGPYRRSKPAGQKGFQGWHLRQGNFRHLVLLRLGRRSGMGAIQAAAEGFERLPDLGGRGQIGREVEMKCWMRFAPSSGMEDRASTSARTRPREACGVNIGYSSLELCGHAALF